MEERAACALLKARFEAAGYRIIENSWFDGAGVRFEIDGYDAERRVGYEYVTEEAGDTWDVGDDVIAALGASQQYKVLILSAGDAPDETAIGAKADAFLATLPPVRPPLDEILASDEAEKKPPAAKKPAVKKPAAKKPAAKKPAAKKPAPKKPATKKAATKKAAAKKKR